MTLKFTMEFTSDKYSWTEAIWNGISASVGDSGPELLAAQLASARVPCLGLGCQLDRVRISSVPANRQVDDVLYANPQVPSWPAAQFAGAYGAAQFQASRAYEALLLHCKDQSGDARNYYLAGAPSSLMHALVGRTDGLDWAAAGDFSNRLRAYETYLTGNNGWGWLSRRSTTYQPVQALVTLAQYPGMIGVQVAAPLVLPPAPQPQKIVVKGFRRLNPRIPGVNGEWTIGATVGPAGSPPLYTYFLLNSPGVPTDNYNTVGVAGGLQLSLASFRNILAVDATERKRGGSLNRPRGRSRTTA